MAATDKALPPPPPRLPHTNTRAHTPRPPGSAFPSPEGPPQHTRTRPTHYPCPCPSLPSPTPPRAQGTLAASLAAYLAAPGDPATLAQLRADAAALQPNITAAYNSMLLFGT